MVLNMVFIDIRVIRSCLSFNLHFYSCYFGIFTNLSNFKAMSTCSFFAEEAQLTPLLRLGAGACAGIIAMSATYPMDLVRGRLTVQVLLQKKKLYCCLWNLRITH
jgi:hypothetical protein